MLIVLLVAIFLMMFALEGQSEKQRGQRNREQKSVAGTTFCVMTKFG